MRRLKAFILALVFIFSAVIVFAQFSEEKVPKGMEVITIGGSGQLIVPKGAKTRMVGAQIIVEGTKEYMSRRFEEMEERFAKMEKNQEDIKKEVESLQDLITKMPQNIVNKASVP